MPTVAVAPVALKDLERLIQTHSLPSATRARVRASIEPLARFPRLGPELHGRWSGYRFLLGPWRWLIIVYVYFEDEDRVTVVGFYDGRSRRSPTVSR